MKIGIIGGSGISEFAKQVESLQVPTPYGIPSSEVMKATLGDSEIYGILRHGKGHRYIPSEVNYRANIFALKSLNVDCVLAVSAVGSLREEISPGDFVLPDQYIDLTKGRPSTLFGNGIVGHVPMAEPNCSAMASWVHQAVRRSDVKCHLGGTYVCIEGPQFSTRAESLLYRSWPEVNVIGMTAMPEAKLAREAGLCYATLGMATDYDAWRDIPDERVSVQAVLDIVRKNVSNFQRVLESVCTTTFCCTTRCKLLPKESVVTGSL